MVCVAEGGGGGGESVFGWEDWFVGFVFVFLLKRGLL